MTEPRTLRSAYDATVLAATDWLSWKLKTGVRLERRPGGMIFALPAGSGPEPWPMNHHMTNTLVNAGFIAIAGDGEVTLTTSGQEIADLAPVPPGAPQTPA